MGNTLAVGSEVEVHKHSCRNGSVCKFQHWHFWLWEAAAMDARTWDPCLMSNPPGLEVGIQNSSDSLVCCFLLPKKWETKHSQDAHVVSHSGQANSYPHLMKKRCQGKEDPRMQKKPEVTPQSEFWPVCTHSYSLTVCLHFLSNLTWHLKYFLVHFVNLAWCSV